jgi:hypothetical protein
MKKKTKKLTPKDRCDKLAADVHMLYDSLLRTGFTSEHAFILTRCLLFRVTDEYYTEEDDG